MKTRNLLGVLVVLAGIYLFFRNHPSKVNTSSQVASASQIPESEEIKNGKPVNSQIESNAEKTVPETGELKKDSEAHILINSWNSSFKDPYGNPISYKWSIENEFGKDAKLSNSDVQKYFADTIKTYQTFNIRLIDFKAGGILDFWSKTTSPLIDVIREKKPGEYIFQDGRLISSFKSENFKRDKIFCVIKMDFDPKSSFESNRQSVLAHIKEVSLLTDFPKNKGVRLLLKPTKNTMNAANLERIDCLAPVSSEDDKQFMNLTLLDLLNATGTPGLYKLLK